MVPFLTILLVVLAGVGIFSLRPVTAKVKKVFHKNPVVDYQIKFQIMRINSCRARSPVDLLP